jgi:chemotaxis protein CheX
MPTETSLEIQRSELVQIVESVFQTMMGLEVIEYEEPWFAAPDRMTSAVHLSGDWNGAVLFECDQHEACRFSARFLSMGMDEEVSDGDCPAVVDDVVRDVLGELTNMIGGNLKCLLPGGVQLSIPSVVDGEYSLRVCGAHVLEGLSFRCDEGVFWVSIVTTRPDIGK